MTRTSHPTQVSRRRRGAVLIMGAVCMICATACALVPSTAPTPTPTPQPTLADDYRVCHLITAGDLSAQVGSSIKKDYYGGYASSPADAFMHCTALLDGPIFANLVIEYNGSGYTFLTLDTGNDPSYDELAALEAATPLTIDGLEGEGITMRANGRTIAAWHYPDDHVLTITITPILTKRDQAPDRTELVTDLVTQLATPIAELAANSMTPQPTTPTP